ncbi:hypothetical protein OAO01_06450 [Oligoflexia bacterium]|nr:hypothetical protein [Oligoflexia bacterium]
MSVKLAIDPELPIVRALAKGKILECDLRPLMRLVPRLKRSAKFDCIEQLIHLTIEPFKSSMFILIAREWNENKKIEGHIIELQGTPGTDLVTSLEDGETIDGNHVFFVRARIPEEDRQKRYRQLRGANCRRKTTEEQRDIRPTKEMTVSSIRELDLNQLLDQQADGGDRRGRQRSGGRPESRPRR